ncbi:MAG: DnaB-like helicase N-terminal domain-containing protein, partial [Terriglobia bacterium]
MSASPVAGKTFPHNLDAERALLGSILLDNTALNVALEVVKSADFYSEAHRMTFQKMVDLSEKSRAAELITLSEELAREGLLEKAGGAAYLASLTDGVPLGSTANISEYARIVRDKSLVRSLINASNNIIAHCFDSAEDPETLIDLAQSQIFEIAGKDVQSGFFRVADIVKASFGTLDVLFDRQQGVTGIATGFEVLDSMTSGLQPGELTIIAARP